MARVRKVQETSEKTGSCLTGASESDGAVQGGGTGIDKKWVQGSQ